MLSWRSFEREISKTTAPDPVRPAYLFRGQSAKEWPLQSSLQRVLRLYPGITAEKALQLESELLERFQSQAHLHLRGEFLPMGEDPLQWWQVMQHYGSPTRLLDWTASPYVAAYFAVFENWDRDGAIFEIHPYTLQKWAQDAETKRGEDGTKESQERLRDPSAPDEIRPVPMRRHSDRTVAQQGHFTYALHILGDQEALISEACVDATSHLKLIVPRKLKPQFLQRLHVMNVGANALFPGDDGLGRYIGDLARLAVYKRAEAENTGVWEDK